METINVNGTDYVRMGDVRGGVRSESWSHVCVIATNGWIFEGYRDDTAGTGGVALAGASVVRCWDNGLGIGDLADPGHKDDYTLDAVGSMEVLPGHALAVIELGW